MNMVCRQGPLQVYIYREGGVQSFSEERDRYI